MSFGIYFNFLSHSVVTNKPLFDDRVNVKKMVTILGISDALIVVSLLAVGILSVIGLLPMPLTVSHALMGIGSGIVGFDLLSFCVTRSILKWKEFHSEMER
jgi:hypothetical protein